MKGLLKTAAVAAFAVAFGYGARASQAALTVIDPGQTNILVDGWEITGAPNVILFAAQNGSVLDVEKTANFTTTSSVQVTFEKVSSSAPSTIVFSDEHIYNNSTVAWTGFDFAVGGIGGVPAFPGLIPTTTSTLAFLPPAGYTGVALSPPSMAPAGNDLTYTGSQAVGAVSIWGGSTSTGPVDELVIDTNGANIVTFDEKPISGSTPPAIPLPAAAVESLVGLLGLGAIASAKKIKSQLMA